MENRKVMETNTSKSMDGGRLWRLWGMRMEKKHPINAPLWRTLQVYGETTVWRNPYVWRRHFFVLWRRYGDVMEAEYGDYMEMLWRQRREMVWSLHTISIRETWRLLVAVWRHNMETVWRYMEAEYGDGAESPYHLHARKMETAGCCMETQYGDCMEVWRLLIAVWRHRLEMLWR